MGYHDDIALLGEHLKQIHLPRWEELPGIDLYMDQMVTVLQKYMAPMALDREDPMITPAMINNYVKLGLIPPPVKKRYGRKHLAFLLAITVFKPILTITEVRDGIAVQCKIIGVPAAYDLFCREQEQAFQAIADQAMGCPGGQVLSGKPIPPDQLPLRMASLAAAARLLAEKSIRLQSGTEPASPAEADPT